MYSTLTNAVYNFIKVSSRTYFNREASCFSRGQSKFPFFSFNIILRNCSTKICIMLFKSYSHIRKPEQAKKVETSKTWPISYDMFLNGYNGFLVFNLKKKNTNSFMIFGLYDIWKYSCSQRWQVKFTLNHTCGCCG